MSGLKVGDRVGVRQLEDQRLHVGKIYEIRESGFIYCETDTGLVFIVNPDVDTIKPVKGVKQ